MAPEWMDDGPEQPFSDVWPELTATVLPPRAAINYPNARMGTNAPARQFAIADERLEAPDARERPAVVAGGVRPHH
jgi:hypothetical protein